MKRLLGFALTLLALPVFAHAAKATVTPTVKCYEEIGGGGRIIHFGYYNDSATTSVALGPDNYFSPPPVLRRQHSTYVIHPRR